MRSIKDRVAALEVYVGTGATAEHNAAYKRIFLALRELLPIIPPTCRRVNCGTYHTIVVDNPGTSFEELICAMNNRIKSIVLTDDDRRVLAALPVKDLKITGCSPESVVNLFGTLFDEY